MQNDFNFASRFTHEVNHWNRKTDLLRLTLLTLGILTWNLAIAQDSEPWWKSLFKGGTTETRQDSVVPLDGSFQPILLPGDSAMLSEFGIGEGEHSGAEALPTGFENRPQGSLSIDWQEGLEQLNEQWHRQEHVNLGYRIQLYSGNLEKARIVRAKARGYAAGIGVYFNPNPPAYEVSVGDFRSKWHALEMLPSWKEHFPYAIVTREPVEINFPSLVKPKPDEDKEKAEPSAEKEPENKNQPQSSED